LVGGSLEGCRPSARAIILRGSAPKRRAPQHKFGRSRGAFFRARVLPVTTNKPRSNSERTIEAVSSTKRHLSTRFQQLKESGTPADAGVRCPHASGVRDAPRSKAACAALRLRARSPAGIPLTVFANGTFVPKAQRRARLPKGDAKAAACRTHRHQSQRCTSRAGRSAGRHDARAARVRIVSFRPRAPHSLRRQGVPSLIASFNERDWQRLLSSFWQVKGVKNYADESVRLARRLLCELAALG
jgi:hypothetical protein